MVGVVVVSKFVTHINEDKFAGMVDYMDREEAITNNNISLNIKDVELDSIERRIFNAIRETGSTNINVLIKDKKLKNMICYHENLYTEKCKLTRYDSNYIFKNFFDKDDEFVIKKVENNFYETHKSIDSDELEKEKIKILKRLDKLIKLNYITQNSDNKNNYKITEKAKIEMSKFKGFQFTNYDTNKIFKLVRDKKYLISIQKYLSVNLNIEKKDGIRNYDYINRRISNNIKYGYIENIKGKLEITKKGLIQEDKIKNPHRSFLEEKLKNLELKSDEFKQGKKIIDEKYSIIDELDYSGIIEYMDREKAKSSKSKINIGLFTADKDNLDSAEKNKLKILFNKSQKNGGVMWHDVVSFDNKFLEKHGIYDSKSNIFDDRKLKEVIRSGANEMLKKENLDELAIWCANIHYNTDNIHVHISTVELNPSKTRGKRKPKSIFAMKSKIVNGITNNNEQYKKINDIIREDIIGRKKNMNFLDDRKLKKLFIEVHSKLPEDRRQWYYNYRTLNNVRPLIDKMTDIYIEKYNRNDLLRLKTELKRQETNLKEAYGAGQNNYYKKYYDTKIQDLKTRMGNIILKEIKGYDNNLKQQKYKSGGKSLFRNSFVGIRIKKIEGILNNSYQHIKNQKEYVKLQNEIERDEQYEKQ